MSNGITGHVPIQIWIGGWRRPSADIRAPGFTVEATDRIPEKIERFLRQSGDPGLLGVHLQPKPRHQGRHPRHRRRRVARSAADDEVVGVVDNVGIELVPMAIDLRKRLGAAP